MGPLEEIRNFLQFWNSYYVRFSTWFFLTLEINKELAGQDKTGFWKPIVILNYQNFELDHVAKWSRDVKIRAKLSSNYWVCTYITASVKKWTSHIGSSAVFLTKNLFYTDILLWKVNIQSFFLFHSHSISKQILFLNTYYHYYSSDYYSLCVGVVGGKPASPS